MNDNLYNQYLIGLLDYLKLDQTYNSLLDLNIYMALLNDSNHVYNMSIFHDEVMLVEDFLRKINNLKVKIQLKQKKSEIDKLTENIINIYDDNREVIDRFNTDYMDIKTIILGEVTETLTSLIDTITKEKMLRVKKQSEYIRIRDKIGTNLKDAYIQDDIYVFLLDNEEIRMDKDEFIRIFDYLRDTNIYSKNEMDTRTNRLRMLNIAKMIKTLYDKSNLDTIVVSSLLINNLIYSDITNLEEIDMSKFNILNVKINELYQNIDNSGNSYLAKWHKTAIKSEYIYDRLIRIIKKGYFYNIDDMIIFEDTLNHQNEFKVSIKMDDLTKIIKNYGHKKIKK